MAYIGSQVGKSPGRYVARCQDDQCADDQSSCTSVRKTHVLLNAHFFLGGEEDEGKINKVNEFCETAIFYSD